MLRCLASSKMVPILIAYPAINDELYNIKKTHLIFTSQTNKTEKWKQKRKISA